MTIKQTPATPWLTVTLADIPADFVRDDDVTCKYPMVSEGNITKFMEHCAWVLSSIPEASRADATFDMDSERGDPGFYWNQPEDDAQYLRRYKCHLLQNARDASRNLSDLCHQLRSVTELQAGYSVPVPELQQKIKNAQVGINKCAKALGVTVLTPEERKAASDASYYFPYNDGNLDDDEVENIDFHHPDYCKTRITVG